MLYFIHHTRIMKRALSNIDIEQIILMAWGDTIFFDTIQIEYGLTESEVKKVMRANQTEKTYIRWRKRVEERNGSSSKHAQLSTKTSTRQKY